MAIPEYVLRINGEIEREDAEKYSAPNDVTDLHTIWKMRTVDPFSRTGLGLAG